MNKHKKHQKYVWYASWQAGGLWPIHVTVLHWAQLKKKEGGTCVYHEFHLQAQLHHVIAPHQQWQTTRSTWQFFVQLNSKRKAHLSTMNFISKRNHIMQLRHTNSDRQRAPHDSSSFSSIEKGRHICPPWISSPSAITWCNCATPTNND